MTEHTIEEHKIRTNSAYRFNVNDLVSAGGSLSAHISLPADSSDELVITSAKVTMLGPYTLKKPVEPDVTKGTENTISNRREGNSNVDSVATGYKNSTYTNETELQSEYIGKDDSQPGAAVDEFGGESNTAVGTVVSGGDFIIELENRSSATEYNGSITIEFYETT
jgi:hypothetical protein